MVGRVHEAEHSAASIDSFLHNLSSRPEISSHWKVPNSTGHLMTVVCLAVLCVMSLGRMIHV